MRAGWRKDEELDMTDHRKPMQLLTGHRAIPTTPLLGWWLIESAPGSDRFYFSHDPEAVDIMERHNALYEAKGKSE